MFHRWHFRAGQKKGYLVGKTKQGKGSKIMAIADGAGLPVAICAASGSPGEVTLVQYTIEHRVVEDTPEKLIGDKTYGSDPLDRGIEGLFGTEMIAPNRRGRKKSNQKQEGRKLRRYKRRWKIERLFAWLSTSGAWLCVTSTMR